MVSFIRECYLATSPYQFLRISKKKVSRTDDEFRSKFDEKLTQIRESFGSVFTYTDESQKLNTDIDPNKYEIINLPYMMKFIPECTIFRCTTLIPSNAPDFRFVPNGTLGSDYNDYLSQCTGKIKVASKPTVRITPGSGRPSSKPDENTNDRVSDSDNDSDSDPDDPTILMPCSLGTSKPKIQKVGKTFDLKAFARRNRKRKRNEQSLSGNTKSAIQVINNLKDIVSNALNDMLPTTDSKNKLSSAVEGCLDGPDVSAAANQVDLDIIVNRFSEQISTPVKDYWKDVTIAYMSDDRKSENVDATLQQLVNNPYRDQSPIFDRLISNSNNTPQNKLKTVVDSYSEIEANTKNDFTNKRTLYLYLFALALKYINNADFNTYLGTKFETKVRTLVEKIESTIKQVNNMETFKKIINSKDFKLTTFIAKALNNSDARLTAI